MASSNRRRDLIDPRGGVGSNSKLRMDRQPMVARMSDPSLSVGKRKEIDNVMKKARASTNEYWDKKLLEVEEKDPNRWRHTGYKKMYIEGDSSSDSSEESYHYKGNRKSRSRSPPHRIGGPRKPSPMSPSIRRRSPAMADRRRSPKSPIDPRLPRGLQTAPQQSRRRPQSPPEPQLRRKSPRPRSPMDIRRRSISPVPRPGRRSPPINNNMNKQKHSILSRTKRPPSPPPPSKLRSLRTPSNSSVTSCSDESCSVCSPKTGRARSRSPSNVLARPRNGPHSKHYNRQHGTSHRLTPTAHHTTASNSNSMVHQQHSASSKAVRNQKPIALPLHASSSSSSSSSIRQQQRNAQSPNINNININNNNNRNMEEKRKHLPPAVVKHRMEEKSLHNAAASSSSSSTIDKMNIRTERIIPSSTTSSLSLSSGRHLPVVDAHLLENNIPIKHSSRSQKIQINQNIPEDPRIKIRHSQQSQMAPPPQPQQQQQQPEPIVEPIVSKKVKDKTISAAEKLRAKVKIEGEKRKKSYSSESEESGSSSESESLPTITSTTRLTLSERFSKMAQWSVDRSNMENMRITKDSTGGAVKVMIEEETESPPRRFNYSPAPIGHFPKELATTAPTGLLSWDDVRVRYDYYKNRGYLRDLDLKDYVKWEEWWYRYQEWLKQERYYEYFERQMNNRRRNRGGKKIPISQRLN